MEHFATVNEVEIYVPYGYKEPRLPLKVAQPLRPRLAGKMILLLALAASALF